LRGRAALILKRRNATGEVYPFLGPGFALRCRYCRWPGAWPLSPSHTLPLTLTYRLGGKFHCKAVDFFPAGFCIGAFPPQKHCKKDISTTKERQNMIIGIDHGYYAIKTRHCSFPAGLTCYGSHEPHTNAMGSPSLPPKNLYACLYESSLFSSVNGPAEGIWKFMTVSPRLRVLPHFS